MGNPSERAVKMLGDIYINCSTCGKSTHPGSIYGINDSFALCGYRPICVDCVDKADDANMVEDEIITICPGCGARMGERADMTYYAGQNWCADCAEDFIGKDYRGRDNCPDCAGCPWVEPTFALCASCSVNTG